MNSFTYIATFQVTLDVTLRCVNCFTLLVTLDLALPYIVVTVLRYVTLL